MNRLDEVVDKLAQLEISVYAADSGQISCGDAAGGFYGWASVDSVSAALNAVESLCCVDLADAFSEFHDRVRFGPRTWTIFWGHSGGPHSNARDASRYAANVWGTIDADDAEEAACAVAEIVGGEWVDYYVSGSHVHVLLSGGGE